MFCSGCGQSVDPSQPFCPNCGRPMPQVVPAVPMQIAVSSRVRQHLQAVSVLWIAYSIWISFHWLIAMSIFSGGVVRYFGHGNASDFPFNHMPWLAPLISVVLGVRVALSMITGIALARRAHWGRVFALVMAFLTLLRPISGTILAIYTLWVLIPASSRAEYEQISV